MLLFIILQRTGYYLLLFIRQIITIIINRAGRLLTLLSIVQIFNIIIH